jgi:uncharacterized protein YcbX
MRIKIGEIAALFRYPVKSMAGESIQTADMGWHGLDGDRRLALRRLDDRSGFPWLTASKLPDLIRFAPQRRDNTPDNLPTHVRTPDGIEWPLMGPELTAEIARRYGSPVEMVHLNRGIFDAASISVITATTVAEVGRLSEQPADVRRFRPNILITSSQSVPFEEDGWVGGVLSFGDGPDSAAIHVTNFDERCAMVNFDPDSALAAPEVLKAIVRVRDNKVGVYAAVTRRGRIAVGQPIFLAQRRSR